MQAARPVHEGGGRTDQRGFQMLSTSTISASSSAVMVMGPPLSMAAPSRASKCSPSISIRPVAGTR